MGSYYSGMMNNEFGYGELRHHGILGQKWGVRRFQNKDGTLTEEGKKRYGYYHEGEIKEMPREEFNRRSDRAVNIVGNVLEKNYQLYDMDKNDLGKQIGKKAVNKLETIKKEAHEKFHVDEAATAFIKARDDRERHVVSELLIPDKHNKWVQLERKLMEESDNANRNAYLETTENSIDYIKRLPKDKQPAAYAYLAYYMGFY